MRAELDEYPSCTEAELSSLYFRKLTSVLTVEKVTASHSWYGNDSIKILTESPLLGTEMELQLVEGTVVALENALKMWLHDQGGDREQLHLLLPPSLTAQGSTPHPANNRPSPVCLKCDMQERLLSPALLPSTPDLGVKTESMHDFQPPNKSLANPSAQSLRVVKYNPGSGSGSGSGVFSYYVLQSSGSLSLLLKPVLTRELMLPCSLPVSMEDPPLPALATVESSLEQLEKDPVFNPLCLDSNLYLHLRFRGLLTRSSQPFGAQGQGRGHRRGASRPPEGSTQRQGRQSQSRARATVAPLPSIPLNKMPRPSLNLSHSRPCAPALFFQDSYEEEDPLIIHRQYSLKGNTLYSAEQEFKAFNELQRAERGKDRKRSLCEAPRPRGTRFSVGGSGLEL
ncbi:Meiosis 1 arrest protein [Anabarilius grahami]|uniref:Meiosis 1 arrest protein n=1 Tax=Anabarilius grahami TaxID=495550 RepID=A0A3N0YPX8_ANAGA|nr:Meiosis 1 arrest protein [Anabarilius grahami]